jgi:hypothetical protein
LNAGCRIWASLFIALVKNKDVREQNEPLIAMCPAWIIWDCFSTEKKWSATTPNTHENSEGEEVYLFRTIFVYSVTYSLHLTKVIRNLSKIRCI